MTNPLSFNGFGRSPWYLEQLDTAETIEGAARAGFAFFAPDTGSLARWLADGRDEAALVRLMRDAGIGVGPLASCGMLDGGDAPLAQLAEAARWAQILGAEVLQVNVAAPTPAARRDAVERACAMLDGTGLKLAIEYLPITPLATLAETLDIVAHVGSARAGTLVDIWHHSRDPQGWETLAAAPLDAIAYVEFDDALPPQSEDLIVEMMDRRTFPGEGVLETERFAAAVRDKGYAGLVSIEVLNREWSTRPAAEFAARAYAASAPYWA